MDVCVRVCVCVCVCFREQEEPTPASPPPSKRQALLPSPQLPPPHDTGATGATAAAPSVPPSTESPTHVKRLLPPPRRGLARHNTEPVVSLVQPPPTIRKPLVTWVMARREMIKKSPKQSHANLLALVSRGGGCAG